MGVMGGDTHGQPVDRRQCCVVMVERKGWKVGTGSVGKEHMGVMGGDTHIQCCGGGRHECDWRRHSPTVLGRKEVRCGDHDGTQRTEEGRHRQRRDGRHGCDGR